MFYYILTQEYCITRQKNIIQLCESLRKGIDALAPKLNVNPERRPYTMTNVNNWWVLLMIN